MNMTYESIKERGALMVVPSDMVSSMANLAAFAPAAFEPAGSASCSTRPRRGRRLMDLWSLLRIVSQRSLQSCRIDFDDRPLQRASLFPMFDDEGRTRMLLITAEESGRIMLADWAPGLFARDWARRNRLRLTVRRSRRRVDVG